MEHLINDISDSEWYIEQIIQHILLKILLRVSNWSKSFCDLNTCKWKNFKKKDKKLEQNTYNEVNDMVSDQMRILCNLPFGQSTQQWTNDLSQSVLGALSI